MPARVFVRHMHVAPFSFVELIMLTVLLKGKKSSFALIAVGNDSMTQIQIHVEKTRNLDLMIIEKFALITKCASHYLPAFYFKLAPAVVLSMHCV